MNDTKKSELIKLEYTHRNTIQSILLYPKTKLGSIDEMKLHKIQKQHVLTIQLITIQSTHFLILDVVGVLLFINNFF